MIFVNYKFVTQSVFPGGEVKVTVPEYSPLVKDLKVTALLHDSDDVMALVMVTNALRHQYLFKLQMHLDLLYFPYARQDRVCNPGEAHGVQAMASIVNLLGYDSVKIWDPHSDAVQAAVNNCVVVSQVNVLQNYLGVRAIQKYTIVSPDAGAEKKVNSLAKAVSSWGLSPNVVYASKVRNLANGQILATNYTGDVKDKDCLIVDDICDGGRTFTELAKKLKEGGAKSVTLYVTHGIFSAGLEPLKEHLDHVYCYHSFTNASDPFVTVFRKQGATNV